MLLFRNGHLRPFIIFFLSFCCFQYGALFLQTCDFMIGSPTALADTDIGKLYDSFVRKRTLMKYQSQSEMIEVILYVSQF